MNLFNQPNICKIKISTNTNKKIKVIHLQRKKIYNYVGQGDRRSGRPLVRETVTTAATHQVFTTLCYITFMTPLVQYASTV